MEDHEIVTLYLERNESAITCTADKYGDYCRAVAFRILGNDEDTEECVNDTYWRAWRVIPPQRPTNLRLFLGKITRNLSLDCYRRRHADKRGEGQAALALEELAECIPSMDTTETLADHAVLTALLDRFLDTLPTREKWVFSRRYWHMDSVKAIADALGVSENHVKVMLHRTRRKLRRELEKEGYDASR